MAEETEQARKPAAKAEIVNVPHTIRSKVSGGGPLTNEMLEKAENVIEEHGVEYVSRVQTQIESLVETVRDARENTAARPQLFADIFQKSHDIRGMGSTFGYDLVTEIGASLCNFVEGIAQHDDDAMAVVSAHVDALRAVVANGVKGDGGKIGREIADGLTKVVAKSAQRSE